MNCNVFYKRAWAEISLRNLRGNIAVISAYSPEIMAVVKANAYGHGYKEICRCLQDVGIGYFGVATLDEAAAVRECCPFSEIAVLSYVQPDYANVLAENKIIQGVISLEYARELSKNLTDRSLRCHVKIDTGMGRVGIKKMTAAACADEIGEINKLPNLEIEGIYTHFPVADSLDEDDVAYTGGQRQFMHDVYDILCGRGIKLKHMHYMNSGACCYGEAGGTLARPGILIYGLKPNSALPIPKGIRPVMSLKALVSQVKTVHAGDCLSYGRTFVAEGDMTVATVSIGYADGYPRALSSKGEVLLNGSRCRVLGRVCMDQIIVDVTGKEVKAGDVATLIGTDGEETVTADDIADLCGTIGYEIVCGITQRVHRQTIEE